MDSNKFYTVDFYEKRHTPRQQLIHATVLALHPENINNEAVVWAVIDQSARKAKGTDRHAIYEYYMPLDPDGRAATRLLNDVVRAAQEYYA